MALLTRAGAILALGGLLSVAPPIVVGVVGCSTAAPDEGAASPCAGAYLLLGSFTDEACLAFLEAEQRKLVVTDAAKAPQWVDPKPGKLAAGAPPTFTWSKGTLAVAPRGVLPAALAHGITNGDGHVLTFRDSAGKELLRVMTTNLGFAPDAPTWAKVAAAKSITVSLVGARFSGNVLATGVSPTASPDVAFTVE